MKKRVFTLLAVLTASCYLSGCNLGNSNSSLNNSGGQSLVNEESFVINASSQKSYGVSVTGGGLYKKGQSVTLKATETTGYEFDGWYEDSTLLSDAKEYTFFASKDMNIIAHVKLTNYTITYQLDGGSFGSAPVTSFTIETPSFDLPIPAKSNYTFKGWVNVLTQESIFSVMMRTTQNLTVKATWEKAKVTITGHCEPNKGTISNLGLHNAGEPIILTVTPDNGYSVQGWYYLNQYRADTESIQITPTRDMDFTCKLDLITYYITYNTDGGYLENNSSKVTSYNVETETFSLPVPTKDGYTFLHWKDEKNNELTSIQKGSYGNKTLTAIYELDEEDPGETYYVCSDATSPAWDYAKGSKMAKCNDTEYVAEVSAIYGESIAVSDGSNFYYTYNTTGYESTNAYIQSCYSIVNNLIYFNISGIYFVYFDTSTSTVFVQISEVTSDYKFVETLGSITDKNTLAFYGEKNHPERVTYYRGNQVFSTNQYIQIKKGNKLCYFTLSSDSLGTKYLAYYDDGDSAYIKVNTKVSSYCMVKLYESTSTHALTLEIKYQ